MRSIGALRQCFAGARLGHDGDDPAKAHKPTGAGRLDVGSSGRPSVTNPDLVSRIRTGAPLDDAPDASWFRGDQTDHSDWPTMAGPPLRFG